MEESKDYLLSAETLLNSYRLIRQNLWFISKWVTGITFLSAIYIFSLPRGYSSKVVLLPETGGGASFSAGSLGALGSMMGMRNFSVEDAIYPEFYPKVMQSSPFLVALLKEKVTLEKDNETVSLFDYFDKKQAQPWWSAIFNLSSDDEAVSDSINPIKITKEQKRIVDALEKSMICLYDKKTEAITISTQAQHPEVAQQMADIIQKRLQEFITDYRTHKARIDENYFQKLYIQSQEDYHKAQRDYSTYADAHTSVVLESYRTHRSELENEMQLKFDVYSRMSNQLQSAQAKVQERTPAFVTVQPATIPIRPSSPKRMITVVMMFLLSFAGSVGCVIVKDYFNKHKVA